MDLEPYRESQHDSETMHMRRPLVPRARGSLASIHPLPSFREFKTMFRDKTVTGLQSELARMNLLYCCSGQLFVLKGKKIGRVLVTAVEPAVKPLKVYYIAIVRRDVFYLEHLARQKCPRAIYEA